MFNEKREEIGVAINVREARVQEARLIVESGMSAFYSPIIVDGENECVGGSEKAHSFLSLNEEVSTQLPRCKEVSALNQLELNGVSACIQLAQVLERRNTLVRRRSRQEE